MGAAPLLTFLKNGEVIRTLQLTSDRSPVVVGRGEDCVVRLEDRAISRRHLVFTQTPEGVHVEKKSEYAPLTVNGKSSSGGLLSAGDVIALGPYLVRVSTQKQEPERPVTVRGAAVSADTPVTGSKTAPMPSEISESDAPAREGAPRPGSTRAFEEAPSVEAPIAIPGLGDALAPVPDSELQPLSEKVGAPEGGRSIVLVPPDAQGESADPEIAPVQSAPRSASAENPAVQELSLPDSGRTRLLEIAESDAATKVAPLGNVAVRLLFKPGTANIEEYAFSGEEISIGRGKSCDIVLNDKRASRKNCIIRKAGLSYVIKDLGSANGTFVNGSKVTEQELSGDDQIQVGDVVFRFLVKSADYSRQLQTALPVQPEDLPSNFSVPVPDLSGVFPVESVPGQPAESPSRVSLVSNSQSGLGQKSSISNAGTSSIPGVVGVAGLPGGSSSKSLFARLPQRQKVLVAVIGLLVIWWAMEDGEPDKKLQRKPQSTPSPLSSDKNVLRTFERLKPEEQKFVETKHALAFDYFKNQDFDKALYELSQLFALVSDYKNSMELKRYSEEGKRLKEAKEEERKRKEEEARIKAKVAELTEEIRAAMDKKDYAKASALFPGILEIEPDNADIAGWRKEIADWEESERIKEIQRQTRAQINKHAWGVYADAKAQYKAGKYRQSAKILRQLGEIGATDRKLEPARLALLKRARAAIAAQRDPLLQEARQSEESGDLARAYQLYHKATIVDPDHSAGYAGMKRLQAVLHDRAKVIYTEAVLAESYSDFETAKKKFKECLSVSPVDDIYHERAKRKLARYIRKGDSE